MSSLPVATKKITMEEGNGNIAEKVEGRPVKLRGVTRQGATYRIEEQEKLSAPRLIYSTSCLPPHSQFPRRVEGLGGVRRVVLVQERRGGMLICGGIA